MESTHSGRPSTHLLDELMQDQGTVEAASNALVLRLCWPASSTWPRLAAHPEPGYKALVHSHQICHPGRQPLRCTTQ